MSLIRFASPALLLSFFWFLSPAAEGQTPRLRADAFLLQAETLRPEQMRKVYLQLIENFVGWSEHLGKFVESDEQESGGGCFEAAGRGVDWPRGNSNLCLAYALLLEEFPDRRSFSIYDIPRERLEDHLRRALRTVCMANKNSSRHKPAKHVWGGPSWQSSLGMIGLVWAAHLRERHLDEDTLALVRELTWKEADHLEKKIPSGNQGNTQSEDCTWNTPVLAFAANKYADHPRAARWDELCKQWAINALSTRDDACSTELVDGRPLGEWIVSENVYPDLTIENHHMWSVGYQCSSQLFGEGALAYRVFGRPVPEAYSHHADRMWRDVTSVLFLWDGDILFPTGQDWSWKVYSSMEYLCCLHCCRQNAAAGAFESRALQMIFRRQLAVGTGDLGESRSATLDFGNQTVKPKRWAFCYLMHKHFTTPPAIPFEEAERGAHGVHVYPHTRVAVHRNAKKCVSVSWHPRFQPIYVLPEGNSTFTDPPFFFPYDRNSGCAALTVVASARPSVRSKYDSTSRPAANVIDGDSETFWVSGPGGGKPGEGPSAERPDWIEFTFEKPVAASHLLLRPRERYGPRTLVVQSSENGQRFATRGEFTATHESRQVFTFPETTSRVFRVLITDAHDPQYPDRPRNAQIREMRFVREGDREDRAGEIAFREAVKTHDGRGMRVLYRRQWPGGVTQYVLVWSLPDEATVYATVFRAGQDASVTIEPLFPLRAAAPPGFEKPVRQYRGVRWLNMSDHVGFVSVDPLPTAIPENRFFLTEKRTHEVKRGEWFGRSVVVVFARQSHDVTARLADKVRVVRDLPSGGKRLSLETSSGTTALDIDFAVDGVDEP